MARLKQNLILSLAAVFSIAGVLSLFTSPALAFDVAKCKAWAQEIKGRAEDLFSDPDFDPGTPPNNTGCPNLCPNEGLAFFKNSSRIRDPGGVLAARITDLFTDNPALGGMFTGDKIFATGQFGVVAFFCDAMDEMSDDFTSVVVGAEHFTPTGCNTDYQKICEANLP
jgi:hypothetical protein